MNNMHKSERIRLLIEVAISSSKDWIFSHQKAISMKKSEIKCTMMEECLQLKALKSEGFGTCSESERAGEEEEEDWKSFKVRAFPWDYCLSPLGDERKRRWERWITLDMPKHILISSVLFFFLTETLLFCPSVSLLGLMWVIMGFSKSLCKAYLFATAKKNHRTDLTVINIQFEP